MASVDSVKKDTGIYQVKVVGGELLPWHMSLFQYEGRLYTIITCVIKGDKKRKLWQMFGEFSNDLSELHIYQTPLTDYNSYRGAACVRPDGMFILYSTTLREHVEGSKSVDGRDIIMAKMPFEEFLQKIRAHS